jgi:hypothetical protein
MVIPAASIVVAPAGIFTWVAGPILEIVLLSIRRVVCGTGAAPVPSSKVPFTIATVAILLTLSFLVNLKIKAVLKQEKVEGVQGTLTKKIGICNFSRVKGYRPEIYPLKAALVYLPGASI